MLLIFVYSLSAHAGAIEVVTHLEVSDSELTQSQLRRIYTMRQSRWSDDTNITVFVLPSQHPLHHRFSKERLQIFPYQLNRIWHKLTYSGLGVAPIVVESEIELIEAIINTPGSIGYIDEAVLTSISLKDNTTNSTVNTEQQLVGIGRFNVVKITD